VFSLFYSPPFLPENNLCLSREPESSLKEVGGFCGVRLMSEFLGERGSSSTICGL